MPNPQSSISTLWSRRLGAIILCCTSLSACTPSQPAANLTFLATADGVNPAWMPEGTPNSLFDRAENRIHLTAALDETIAFRLSATYSGDIDADVSVTVDDWHSGDATLTADAVTIFRVHSVHVSRWPGWHIRSIAPDRRYEPVDDVLVPADAPRGGLPCRMSDGDTLSLWVDVDVSKGTSPGVFWSKLRLRCDGETTATVDLRLEVLPFVLPGRQGVVLAADVDLEALFAHHVTYQGKPCRATRIMGDSPIRSELQSILDTTARMLQRHKVSPLMSTHYPVVKIDALGALRVGWEDYDCTVEGYLDGTKFVDRAALPLWVIPFDERFPAPPAYGAAQSPTYSRHLREYLAQCAEHFAERGWLARSFVKIPYAETPNPRSVQASEHFARVIRKADPRVRILSHLFPQDLEAYGWPDFPTGDLLGYVDVWCPPAQFYAPPEPIGGVEPARMWMAVDRPPFSGTIELGVPAADTRVVPWQACREKAPVVWLGTINPWPDVAERLTAQDCIESSGGRTGARAPLLYPGAIAGLTEPIPSVRLKRLRRGMLDLSYLELMRAKGIGHLADVLIDSLAPYAGAKAYRYHYADPRAIGWVRDPRWWREAKRIMIGELELALQEGFPEQQTRTAANVRWRRFIEAVRHVRLEVEGVRVRRVPRAAHGDATIECTVVVHNHKRTPVSGSIDFGELPVGWSGLDAPVDVFVPPCDSSRIILVARAAVVTWDENGVRNVPIEFTTNEGRVRTVSARMSYLAAQPLQGEIRIDGDLSDWPPSVGNLASGFTLIAAGAEGENSRSTSATRVYVSADAQALYFAFHCATQGTARVHAVHSNVVNYDDWIPVGEELVEIALDPSGAGTHSTSDLYHIVIKPSGALWERGINADPPTGRRRVWAADVQHAARTYPDHWVAEVRIPLEAFDTSADTPTTRGRIWGVNFSRFDLEHQEYSNWAGAIRNFYNPASLGNFALP